MHLNKKDYVSIPTHEDTYTCTVCFKRECLKNLEFNKRQKWLIRTWKFQNLILSISRFKIFLFSDADDSKMDF